MSKVPPSIAPAERAFRVRLRTLLDDLGCPIPPPLWCALEEHLYRCDAQGYSLCWDGPERQRLLAELHPILAPCTGETL